MKSLSIYLADLSHDSVGLATEVFPLNVGLVGAYCKKKFGDAVDIKIFKYVSQLEEAILNSPPDVLALSNYPWCHNAGLAMLRLLKERRPESIRVMGGPNFPHRSDLQEEFLQKRPILDAYIYLDGEIPFANLVQFIFEVGDLAKARARLKTDSITGLAQLNSSGKLLSLPVPARMENMDDIPSPYLTGLMDPFFDGRLSPMIQTNRGCPFTCTYCHDGTRLVSKINHFSLDRVKAEIAYIAERVPGNIKSLFLSDLNFGMYPRDAEISHEIARVRAKYDYPHYIDTTTGKNSKDKVIKNVEILSGALYLTMSVQSLSSEVLENVKRQNMRLDDFLGLRPALKKAGLPTTSEVILGLPGETKESHIKGLGQLLDKELDHVFAYTLMLLNGTELNLPEERERWGFKSKFRIIPRDFSRLRSGEKVVEVEEVVVATNTLPFEDYVYCRKFVQLLVVTNNAGFKPLVRFIHQSGLHLVDILTKMLDYLDRGDTKDLNIPFPEKLRFYVKEYERETREELWDTEEELVAFFQNDEHYQGLIEGRYGANLSQTYKAKIWAHTFEELAGLCFAVVKQHVLETGKVELVEQLDEIERFCKARTFNLFGEDRMSTNPEVSLNYDYIAWVDDPEERPLESFKFPETKSCRFELTEKQYKSVEAAYEHFGRNDLGKGKVLIRVSPNTLWRSPRDLKADKTPGFYSVVTSGQIRN